MNREQFDQQRTLTDQINRQLEAMCNTAAPPRRTKQESLDEVVKALPDLLAAFEDLGLRGSRRYERLGSILRELQEHVVEEQRVAEAIKTLESKGYKVSK